MAFINKITAGSVTCDVGGYGTGTTSATWSGTAPSLYQNVTVSGLPIDACPVVDVNMAGCTTVTNVETYQSAWSKIWRVEVPAAGKLKIYASEAVSAIPINVKW